MDSNDPRLKKRMKALAETISQAVSENPEIREALQQIKAEGYTVDIILSSIALVSRKEAPEPEEPISLEFNAFDRSFLQAIRIRLNRDDDDPDAKSD